MIEFQAISWFAKNDAEFKSRVHIFGRTARGAAVHVEVPFNPWFYVRSGAGHTAIVERVRRGCRGLVIEACRTASAVDFAGFKHGRRDTFTRLEFDNIWAFRKGREVFEDDKRAETFEGNVDPVLKLLHLRDLPPCGWISVDTRDSEMGGEVRRGTCILSVGSEGGWMSCDVRLKAG